MTFGLPSDSAPISAIQQSFGTPGQTKVSGDPQRETTHDICCLAAELFKKKPLVVVGLDWESNKTLAALSG